MGYPEMLQIVLRSKNMLSRPAGDSDSSPDRFLLLRSVEEDFDAKAQICQCCPH